MKKILLWMITSFFVSSVVMANLTTPVQNDLNTIGLWNFDSDTNTTVNDIAQDAMNGNANEAELVAMPDAPTAFQNSRRFYQSNSLIDLGIVNGSKLDLQGKNEFSLEVNIRLENQATENHVIWESNQLHLVVNNGKIGAFVRQPSGLIGFYYQNNLTAGINYSVLVVWKEKRLTLFINDKAVDSLVYEHDIQAVSNTSAHALIGGNIYGQFFPGYIDDVRLSNVARIENQPPMVEIISPNLSVPLDEIRPEFNISILDASGIDVDATKILLNDVQQNGLVVTQDSITGFLDNDLKRDRINTLEIRVTDIYGNSNVQKFDVVMEARSEKGEYEADANTLLLYHFNEYDTQLIYDSSLNGNDGYIPDNHEEDNVYSTKGVFSLGKYLNSIVYTARPSRIATHQFTFETWMKPSDNTSGDIFKNGEITITRNTSGYIQLTMTAVNNTYYFYSNSDLFKKDELHHLAITWDGTKETQNLRFFIDGVMFQVFDAPMYCDFKNVPELTVISSVGYKGMLDEMRLSNIVREGFSIPALNEEGIDFNNVYAGATVNEEYPDLDIRFTSLYAIDLEKVRIFLNDIDQTNSPDLSISLAGITGKMNSPVNLGHNKIRVEFEDELSNYRVLDSWFLYVRNNGGAPYDITDDTLLLIDFNSSLASEVFDSSNYSRPVAVTYTPVVVPGVRGNARENGNISIDREILLSSRSFTVEGFFKATSNYTNTTLVNMNSGDSYLKIFLNESTGAINYQFSNKGNSLNRIVADSFPLDNNFHHIAFVYDHESKFAQVKLLVDGKLVNSQNFNCYCQFQNPFDVILSGKQYFFAIDEFRIMDRAVYDFNLGGTLSPMFRSFSLSEGGNINIENPVVTFAAEDSVGVNTAKTRVFLNGQSISTFTRSELGGVVNFEVDLTGVTSGGNKLEVIIENSLGNTNIKRINFNAI